MSKEKKKKSGEISRRAFLKDAGLVVGGAAIGSTVLLAACAGETETETLTKTQTATKTVTSTAPGTTKTVTVEVPFTAPASQKYLIVDTTECAGCQTCMAACSLAHEGKVSLSLSRIQTLVNPLGRFPDDFSQEVCRQCVRPACVEICPTDALYVDTANGNIRVIDEGKCLGASCKLCLGACPYIPHRVIWNHEKNVAIKCDLCINTPYWDGEEPACVSACVASAIKVTTDVPDQKGEMGYKVDMYTEPCWERGWL